MTRTATETVWVHAGCGGPVYFEVAGGFCWQCGAGPLHPYSGDRYVHQDETLVHTGEAAIDGRDVA